MKQIKTITPKAGILLISPIALEEEVFYFDTCAIIKVKTYQTYGYAN